MSWVWGILGLGILSVLWVVFGAFNAQGRLRAKEKELESLVDDVEEWEGIVDVRRKIRDSLNDPDERQRLFDKYNKDDKGK